MTTRFKSARGLMGAGLAVALLVPVAACNDDGGKGSAGSSSSSSNGSGSQTTDPQPTGSSAADEAALAKFYSQKLDWKECGAAKKCAELEVPIDYKQPDGKTTKISLLKVAASLPGQRKGSLVVNPGGPGGSGVEYASYAPFIVSPKVLARYDIVGFDPRGVGKSSPIWCYRGKQMDDYLGADPTPDDEAEEKTMQENAKKFGEACKQNNPDLFAHVSTEEVARDMDILRAALGESKLTYLGKSYGTFLGATYAGLFPTKVGRFVLDGVSAPDLTSKEMGLGQAEGFERATRAYMQDCTSKPGCPMGGNLDEGLKNLKGFLDELDKSPLPVTNDSVVKDLTEGWGLTGIIAAMYSKSDWPRLTAALKEAKDEKKGDKLMALADQYASRGSDGAYSSNLLQALSAVNCLDRPDSPNLEDYRKEKDEYVAKSPTFGTSMMWSGVTCGMWPEQTGRKPEKIKAAGSDPILVVGTTRDPATPYEWAKRLADQLENGHLLSYDGDGHTAYYNLPNSNSCVDNAVDDYLLDGKVPEKDKMCK